MGIEIEIEIEIEMGMTLLHGQINRKNSICSQ